MRCGNKKKGGRAAGRATTEPQVFVAEDPPAPSSSSSSSAAALVSALTTGKAPSSPPSTSSTALAKTLRHEASASATTAAALAAPSPSAASAAVAAASAAAAATASLASASGVVGGGGGGATCSAGAGDSEEDFQDALEDLGEDEPLPVTPEEDSVAALLKKHPSVRVPVPSRDDWAGEMLKLERLVQDTSVSTDEKVRLLHEAYTQRVEDVRCLEEHRMAIARCADELASERDRCKKEAVKEQSTKEKLEESCREMQQLKVNIKQENKRIVEDEKERQADLNDKFQAAMKDVDEKMKTETEVREHFIKENEDLRTKLNKFMETYEEQERHLAEKNALRNKEIDVARERLREYETKGAEAAVNAVNLEKKNKALEKTTTTLRAELQSVLDRFDEFHESVNGSSQKHGECKTEIDGLSAKLKDLDAENLELKENKAITDLTKEKEQFQKQRDALERLCGNLQAEIEKIRERAAGKG